MQTLAGVIALFDSNMYCILISTMRKRNVKVYLYV